MKRFLMLFQFAVGAMDSVTGVCLVAAPVLTLRMMGVKEEVASPLMASWVGVFVLAVGLSYFLVRRVPSEATEWAQWRMQWKMSALVRVAVGIFVAFAVARGALEGAWVTVAVTDLAVALVQVTGLKLGWLSGEES